MAALAPIVNVFFSAVLPVFSVVAVGLAFGRKGTFDVPAAVAINRFVFYIALPILLFWLIARAPFDQFNWLLITGFLLSEIALYAIGFAIARKVFGRPLVESLLIGMSTAFANQVFFVLPIARQLYGDTGAMPVIAVSIFDVVVLLSGTIILLDAVQAGSPLRGLRTCLRNPPIVAIAAGILANYSALPITGGLEVFARFVGETAAPCSLFALGIILAQAQPKETLLVPFSISALKLVAMPLVAWLVMAQLFQVGAQWANPALLVAAGPCGAMPFVLALHYQAPVSVISRSILISTIGSLATVTIMTQVA